MSASLSRRAFLERLASVGAAAAGLGALAGCVPDRVDVEDLPDVDASACAGYDAANAELRRELEYTDRSDFANNLCATCANYAEGGAGDCGACSIIGGPVAPAGWCTSYVPVQA